METSNAKLSMYLPMGLTQVKRNEMLRTPSIILKFGTRGASFNGHTVNTSVRVALHRHWNINLKICTCRSPMEADFTIKLVASTNSTGPLVQLFTVFHCGFYYLSFRMLLHLPNVCEFITTLRTTRKARMKTQRHVGSVTLAGCLIDTMDQRVVYRQDS